ncbi:hypothetical protein HNY73_013912 [Argiope bruennichi]|uniref:Uncharacterized protein n=1 Tax=Argiope bruennichi TaxID=94029 RepID=A0A8T0ENN3_ARGBR|nr:hypothetical protein HNY73_013912 [Argiope bruennichi]
MAISNPAHFSSFHPVGRGVTPTLKAIGLERKTSLIRAWAMRYAIRCKDQRSEKTIADFRKYESTFKTMLKFE